MKLIISASAAIIKDKQILLCLRSKDEKRFPEHWTFPGGKKDEGELLSEAARREVKEEVNLDFKPGRKFGFYEIMKEDFHNISHVYLGDFSGEVKTDEDEISECRWFSYEEAKNLPLAFSYSETIENLRKKELL